MSRDCFGEPTTVPNLDDLNRRQLKDLAHAMLADVLSDMDDDEMREWIRKFARHEV